MISGAGAAENGWKQPKDIFHISFPIFHFPFETNVDSKFGNNHKVVDDVPSVNVNADLSKIE